MRSIVGSIPVLCSATPVRAAAKVILDAATGAGFKTLVAAWAPSTLAAPWRRSVIGSTSTREIGARMGHLVGLAITAP
jgi:hypothetical protein